MRHGFSLAQPINEVHALALHEQGDRFLQETDLQFGP